MTLSAFLTAILNINSEIVVEYQFMNWDSGEKNKNIMLLKTYDFA
jgi:hypothetical protein